MPQRAIKYAVMHSLLRLARETRQQYVCWKRMPWWIKKWMLSVAKEFNAPMTAIISPIVSDARDSKSNFDDAPCYHIWWCTPTSEVGLCGHGTLAAAHFLFKSDFAKDDVINFVAEIGVVSAKKLFKEDFTSKESGEKFFVELNFPIDPLVEGRTVEPSLPKTLSGVSVVNIQKTSSNDLMIELSSGKEVATLEPNFEEIKNCEERRVIVTGSAQDGSEYDFFSRVFCPKFGVDEDPVCGSAHCALAPYWSKKLNKQCFTAFMASPRSGVLYVELEEKSQRVRIRGEAVTIMLGTLLA